MGKKILEELLLEKRVAAEIRLEKQMAVQNGLESMSYLYQTVMISQI